jgi:hypothetical protein
VQWATMVRCYCYCQSYALDTNVVFFFVVALFIFCKWGGSMIFASQDPESKAFVVFLTVVVAAINIGMLIWLVVGMAKEYAHEQKEEAAKNGDKRSSLSNKLSNARDLVQRWRFSRMTPEAQQKAIRRRTIDAGDGNTAENPVTIEMTDINDGESAGEIKVDDDELESTIQKSEPANQANKKKKTKKNNYMMRSKSNKRRQAKQTPVQKSDAQQARSKKLKSLHTKRQSLDAANDGNSNVFYNNPSRVKENPLSAEISVLSVEIKTMESGGIETVNTKKRKSFRKIDDAEHGVYFQNVETNDTVWELPEDGDAVVEENQLQTNPMKRKSFKRIDDTEHGVYFQDVETNDTVWELPEDGIEL